MTEKAVEVIVKMRRPGNKAAKDTVEILDTGRLQIERTTFEFDAVVPPDVPSRDFYERHIDTAVLQALDGYNACVLCYGFTGGGKTYTMFGSDAAIAPSYGVSFYAANSLLAAVGLVDLRMQIVEVYMDKVYDLLDPANVYVRVLGDGLHGASERTVTDAGAFESTVRQAVAHRQTAVTGVNVTSSRSHCIVILRVAVRHETSETRASVYLVDLAGCERQSETQTEGLTLRESQSINKSVFAINKVVLACSGHKAHIPYRDSKITMVLHNAFGGNSRTLVVLCCDGAKQNETVSALRFGTRCRMITNRAQQSVEEDDPRDTIIAELQRQIRELRDKLESLALLALPELVALPELISPVALVALPELVAPVALVAPVESLAPVVLVGSTSSCCT